MACFDRTLELWDLAGYKPPRLTQDPLEQQEDELVELAKTYSDIDDEIADQEIERKDRFYHESEKEFFLAEWTRYFHNGVPTVYECDHALRVRNIRTKKLKKGKNTMTISVDETCEVDGCENMTKRKLRHKENGTSLRCKEHINGQKTMTNERHVFRHVICFKAFFPEKCVDGFEIDHLLEGEFRRKTQLMSLASKPHKANIKKTKRHQQIDYSKANSKKIIVYHDESCNNIHSEYTSISEAANKLDLTASCIKSVCESHKKYGNLFFRCPEQPNLDGEEWVDSPALKSLLSRDHKNFDNIKVSNCGRLLTQNFIKTRGSQVKKRGVVSKYSQSCGYPIHHLIYCGFYNIIPIGLKNEKGEPLIVLHNDNHPDTFLDETKTRYSNKPQTLRLGTYKENNKESCDVGFGQKKNRKVKGTNLETGQIIIAKSRTEMSKLTGINNIGTISKLANVGHCGEHGHRYYSCQGWTFENLD